MLNEAQHRHVSTAIRVAEDRLLNVQRLMHGDAEVRRLLDVENDLSEEERAFVSEKLAVLLGRIANLSEQFSLNPEWRSLRRALVANLSIAWADLQDVKTPALRGYGETDPRLRDCLDPLVNRIADGLLEICRAISQKGEE